MKRLLLEHLDKSIDSLKLSSEIFDKRRCYYICYNEPLSVSRNLKAYTLICGYFAWGTSHGSDSILAEKNGVWIGSFRTTSQALYFAKKEIKLFNISQHT